MALKGNKGEWSELYVLIRILAYKKLFAANDEIQDFENNYIPVIKVMRTLSDNRRVEYRLSTDSQIEVYIDNQMIREIPSQHLLHYSELLHRKIREGSNRAFEIPEMASVIRQLECERLAAPSSDKSDIQLQIQDTYTGFRLNRGFSIKSELGNPPTLLNASFATNFEYEIIGLNERMVTVINNIETRNKIMDRMQMIIENAAISFSKATNHTFANNMMLIDSRMEELLGHVVLKHYKTGEASCQNIIYQLEDDNPMNYPKRGFYEYKFKKFLSSIALGMVPSREWNGQDDATGGYIIVTDAGDTVVYHLYNRNLFEQYLFEHTKFERGSTDRHKYARIYSEGTKTMIKLNLQIRFT